MESRTAARRTALRESLERAFAEGIPGRWLIEAARWSTVVFSLSAAAATVAQGSSGTGRAAFVVVAVIVDLAFAAAGVVVFVVGLVWGARRSRTEEVTMSGWWFLSGSAPGSVRRVMLGSIFVQTVVAFTTAAIRPFTELAFGTLVPMLPLALTGAWGARHGWFPPRRGSV